MTNNPTIDGVSREFVREGRYIVVKPDCEDSLRTERLRNYIEEMCFHTLDCVVVEADWPEYEPVWKMIEARVAGKPSELDAARATIEHLRNDLDGTRIHASDLRLKINNQKSTIARLEARITQLESEKEFAAATYQAARDRIAELEQDKARLDALDSNCWDVRFESSPNGDSGDSSINIEIVGHWMDNPFERVIGEDYNENLRAAIDQAMTAPAYPPERPEYPEIDACLDATAALNGPAK